MSAPDTNPALVQSGDAQAAARILARQAPANRVATAVGAEVLAAERRRGRLIRTVAELPALPPPDPRDRYTPRALTVTWLSGKSPHTQRGYLRELDDWLHWCEANQLDPLDAHGADGDAWKATMTARKRAPDGTITLQKPSATTVKHRIDAVSSWYAYLLRHERAQRNPMVAVTRPPVPATSPLQVLDDDAEYQAFLDYIEERATRLGTETAFRDTALIRALFTLAVRVTGLCTARIENIRRAGQHTNLHYTKKGGQDAHVPIGPGTLAAFERYWAVRAEREGVPRDKLSGPVLASTPHPYQPQHTGGRALTQRDAQRILSRIAREAGIQVRLSPHSGRATVATRALRQGAPPRAVQALLGVASLDTAMRYDRTDYTGDRSPVYLLDPK
ncbi:tyrosine-type recombinase/integrase [Amycolatopsis magusensis]|uniref:tyrosine-type recombinase/integrase n=1 Tax=Amycolatopsis magusensis TaxID=882444 RepID=UPI003C2C662C